MDSATYHHLRKEASMIDRKYPRDATGDALRRVRADGSDMSAPMDVDFVVAAPNEAAGHLIADKARVLGYKVKVARNSADEKSGRDRPPWTCCCTRRMVASYD